MRTRKISDDMDASETGKSAAVSITFFVKDRRKSGGEYLTADGRVKKLDRQKGLIVMEDGTQIQVRDIYEIQR